MVIRFSYFDGARKHNEVEKKLESCLIHSHSSVKRLLYFNKNPHIIGISTENVFEGLFKVAYTDDVDFIGQNYADINKIQEVKKKYQLKVNKDKTEYTISKCDEGWKGVKKEGSPIDDNKDIQRTKELDTGPQQSQRLKTSTKIQIIQISHEITTL